MPCVASQHYFTEDGWQYRGSEVVAGTDKTMKEHIDYLISLRKSVGIEFDDSVNTTGTTSACYVGEIVGSNGTLLVKIGNVTAATGSGYTGNNPIYAGKNFAIWQKNVDGMNMSTPEQKALIEKNIKEEIAKIADETVRGYYSQEMQDKIMKFLAHEGKISVICASTTELVEKARQTHDLSPVATAAFGRLLTITAIMGNEMKGEKNKLTIQSTIL